MFVCVHKECHVYVCLNCSFDFCSLHTPNPVTFAPPECRWVSCTHTPATQLNSTLCDDALATLFDWIDVWHWNVAPAPSGAHYLCLCLCLEMRYAAAVIDACGWKAIAQWQIANRLLAAVKKKRRKQAKKNEKKTHEIVNMKSKAFGNSAQHKSRIITHLWDSRDKANNRVRLAYQWHCVPGRMCGSPKWVVQNQDMRFSRRFLGNAAYELLVFVFAGFAFKIARQLNYLNFVDNFMHAHNMLSREHINV